MNANLTSGKAAGEGSDTMTQFENLTGGPNNDTLTGSKGPNVLQGLAGNDTLNTVDGIGGNDTADGGDGTDTCTVDSGDIVISCP